MSLEDSFKIISKHINSEPCTYSVYKAKDGIRVNLHNDHPDRWSMVRDKGADGPEKKGDSRISEEAIWVSVISELWKSEITKVPKRCDGILS